MTAKPQHWLVTAGPTVEDIDAVRFISNRATGRLGVELARAALRAGHRVTLVHGPISAAVENRIPRSRRLKVVPVRSAAQMHAAVMRHAPEAGVVVMNAAVADYTPRAASRFKLKKSARGLLLHLAPTVDILKRLGALKRRRAGLRLIGFALETGWGRTARARRKTQLSEARRKLAAKNLDAIILDTPQAAGAARGDFTVLTRDGTIKEYCNVTKVRLARLVVTAFSVPRQTDTRCSNNPASPASCG